MVMEFSERVSVDLAQDGIAQVRLIRGAKLNALDSAMFDGIISAGHYLHKLNGLRVAVLSGEGRAFCAGLDLMDAASIGKSADAPLTERSHGNANRYQQAAMVWRKLPVPVIAALHGVCFGGGMQIASGADIRVAHPEARLSIMEMKLGIVPDMGGYALWRGLVRDDVLRELVYTNREFSGVEAQVLGLVTRVANDPLAAANEIAGEIANRNPHAIRAAKRLHAQMVDRDANTILLEESIEQHALIGSRNQLEAVQAVTEKRPPKFDDV